MSSTWVDILNEIGSRRPILAIAGGEARVTLHYHEQTDTAWLGHFGPSGGGLGGPIDSGQVIHSGGAFGRNWVIYGLGGFLPLNAFSVEVSTRTGVHVPARWNERLWLSFRPYKAELSVTFRDASGGAVAAETVEPVHRVGSGLWNYVQRLIKRPFGLPHDLAVFRDTRPKL